MIFQSDPGSAQETRHPRGDLNLFELRPAAARAGTGRCSEISHTTQTLDEQFMILFTT